MKALKTILVIGVAAATLTVNSVQAAGINKREAAQRHSIQTGFEDGSLTAAQRANAQWKQMLSAYEEPALDEAVDEEMREFIERRKASMPDAIG